MMTKAQWDARQQILACIDHARAALDHMEHQVNSSEHIIGAHVRDYANDVTGWMYHTRQHTTRTDPK